MFSTMQWLTWRKQVTTSYSSFHIHKATADTINAGLKPESNIETTDKYATVEQAVQYFISFINLCDENKNKYFPNKDFGLFENHD